MKKLSINLKHLTLSLIIIIAGFTFASKADAWSAQYTSDCNDGTANGIVTTASLIPNIGPFPVNSGEIMDAYAIVTTTCASETVKVTVANNSDSEIEIIPETIITSGIPIFSNTANLPVPATANTLANPSYYVHFKTGVEEILIVQNYSFGVTDKEGGGAITGVCTLGTPSGGDPGYIMMRDLDTEQNATARGVTHVVVTQEIIPLITDIAKIFLALCSDFATSL